MSTIEARVRWQHGQNDVQFRRHVSTQSSRPWCLYCRLVCRANVPALGVRRGQGAGSATAHDCPPWAGHLDVQARQRHASGDRWRLRKYPDLPMPIARLVSAPHVCDDDDAHDDATDRTDGTAVPQCRCMSSFALSPTTPQAARPPTRSERVLAQQVHAMAVRPMAGKRWPSRRAIAVRPGSRRHVGGSGVTRRSGVFHNPHGSAAAAAGGPRIGSNEQCITPYRSMVVVGKCTVRSTSGARRMLCGLASPWQGGAERR
ncbi:hypothetical protein DCS_05752 [Drechmeria coniospora]|uniref:Uncharacterized protein n=1 Tax=Drechmeria coniospora TaxID=98403 RepID=A0A151GNP7_DRECN|nr:hypothetical protein DCS_05752 [Drechmeria coniospora]KYK58735.1 hypothetical protein DCS_05752 [Drechmeria coniospora]